MTTKTKQPADPLPPRGKPRTISDDIVNEIRRRGALPLRHGDQKVIAYDLGLSTAYVNQILRGYRRKLA